MNVEKRNEMYVEFDSNSVNEGFARMTTAAFAAQLNPTIDELEDIKTAVSEAVTNSIIHGYEGERGKVMLSCVLTGDEIHIAVKDNGRGIENVEQAKEPFFTTKPELERSGMGFSFMEAFMDKVEVKSQPGVGTEVLMYKRIAPENEN